MEKFLNKIRSIIAYFVGTWAALFLSWFFICFLLMFISAGEVPLCKEPNYRKIETYVPGRKAVCWLFAPEGKE